jgi:serine kinase of HPr protein (carbohydrate metabolism regulator)
MSAPGSLRVHGNAVAIGERGILIRGPSGAGKSGFSLALLDGAERRGVYAALVADDRTLISAVNGRIMAAGVPGFEGLIERRGEGLIRVRYEPSVVIGLVVDLAPHGRHLLRFPEQEERTAQILGLEAPALDLDFAADPGSCVAATMRKLRFGSPAIANFA